MKILRRLNIKGEAREEGGAERGVGGGGEQAVEVAPEVVRIRGEAWWAGGVEEGATCLRQQRHHLVDVCAFCVIVLGSTGFVGYTCGGSGCCGGRFRDFG